MINDDRKTGVTRRHRSRPGVATLLAALAMLVASVTLAACGSDLGAGGNEGEVSIAEATGEPSGELTISTWPYYIDKNSVNNFEQATGIKVDYIEDVNDNNEFFSKLQPSLQNGDSAGRSIFVVTSWMAEKMHDLGYLQEFDKDAIPNVEANLIPSLREPAFDPERSFAIPWQSGMTGIVLNRDKAPDVTSVNDLFDPKYKGKITVLTELRDTVPLVMMADGVDPESATTEDWLAAIQKLQDAADSGQLRDFTGNDYTDDMARGDVIAAIGWSGDAIQLQADDPAIDFQMPDEGCVQWSDEMVIPVGAPNPTAAYAWMDYVYDPKNQAPIAAYNSYVTPVDGVKPIFEKTDPELAKSPLIFPTEDYTAKCVAQVNPPEDGAEEIEQAFSNLVTGGGPG